MLKRFVKGAPTHTKSSCADRRTKNIKGRHGNLKATTRLPDHRVVIDFRALPLTKS